MKQIVEKSDKFDMDMYQLFLDFRQAYGSENRYRLWKAMTQLGIPKTGKPAKLAILVKACVQHSKCKVKFNAKFSK